MKAKKTRIPEDQQEIKNLYNYINDKINNETYRSRSDDDKKGRAALYTYDTRISPDHLKEHMVRYEVPNLNYIYIFNCEKGTVVAAKFINETAFSRKTRDKLNYLNESNNKYSKVTIYQIMNPDFQRLVSKFKGLDDVKYFDMKNGNINTDLTHLAKEIQHVTIRVTNVEQDVERKFIKESFALRDKEKKRSNKLEKTMEVRLSEIAEEKQKRNRQDITSLYKFFTEHEHEVRKTNLMILEIKEDVKEIKSDIKDVKKDIQYLKNQMHNSSSNMNILEQIMRTMQERHESEFNKIIKHLGEHGKVINKVCFSSNIDNCITELDEICLNSPTNNYILLDNDIIITTTTEEPSKESKNINVMESSVILEFGINKESNTKIKIHTIDVIDHLTTEQLSKKIKTTKHFKRVYRSEEDVSIRMVIFQKVWNKWWKVINQRFDNYQRKVNNLNKRNRFWNNLLDVTLTLEDFFLHYEFIKELNVREDIHLYFTDKPEYYITPIKINKATYLASTRIRRFQIWYLLCPEHTLFSETNMKPIDCLEYYEILCKIRPGRVPDYIKSELCYQQDDIQHYINNKVLINSHREEQKRK